MKTLAGMNDEELRLSIIDACKRHIPNIDLPPKYHAIVNGLPMIYCEGMVKGYEFCEDNFKERLTELERENAELKRIIAESKEQKPVGYVRKYAIEHLSKPGTTVIDHYPRSDDDISLYALPIIIK